LKNIKPSFRKKLGLRIFREYKKAQSSLHDLTYLFWECTLRCNISCLHCGSDCHKDSQVKDMPSKDFLAVTSELKNYYNPNKVMIVITGGEPLMRNDLEHVGNELYKQGYPWGFVTNGVLLTEKRFQELLKAGLRSITVSLDGFEDTHEWLRGKKGSFNRAVEAIKMIVNTKDLVYDVATCISKKNFHQLNDLKKFLVDLGVRKWRIFTIFPTGRAKNNPELDITNEQMRELMQFLKDTRNENHIKVSYGCEGFLGNFESEVRDGYYFCRAGINISSILADGSVAACPNIHHRFIQGNIYTENFIDIWNKKYQIYRDRKWMKRGKCKKCEMFRYCEGNSFHLREPENDQPLRCHYEMLSHA